MIAFLSGEILKKLEKSIIISNVSIGYEVKVATALFEQVKEKDLLELFIHTHVREAEISLYGFQNTQELKLFRKLINVSGIGPRSAMDFLSIPQDKLKAAIIQEDAEFITQIPGIGKKTAQRVILELKNKLDIEDSNIELERLHRKIDEDAATALKGLGYQNYHIKKVLKELPKEIQSTEEIIKYFLQNA